MPGLWRTLISRASRLFSRALVARFRIGHADGRVEERELSPGSYRVGREAADVSLPHGSVSAYHAQLEVRADGVIVQDAGSRNGTLDPQGKRLTEPYVLMADRPIRLGACTITLPRSPGHAGGTRIMHEVPAVQHAGPQGAALQQHAGPQRAAPQRAALQHAVLHPDTRALPRIAWWIKLAGVSAILLLGLVSLRTCGALVEALAR